MAEHLAVHLGLIWEDLESIAAGLLAWLCGLGWHGGGLCFGWLGGPLGRVDFGRLGVAAAGLLCTVAPLVPGSLGRVDLGRLGVAAGGLLSAAASVLVPGSLGRVDWGRLA